MTATQEAQEAGAQVNGPERAPQQASGVLFDTGGKILKPPEACSP